MAKWCQSKNTFNLHFLAVDYKKAFQNGKVNYYGGTTVCKN
jgi:hypothetical protein